MNVARQGVSFILVGCFLVIADWATFVLLTVWGVGTAPANLFGRVLGALLGFWLNGRITFRKPGVSFVGHYHFARYVVLWLVLTALSTLLVTALAEHLTLHAAWLAKPVVEAGVALLSFIASRYWVYR